MKFIAITETNYPKVAEIYKLGLETKIATFETQVLDFSTWNKKYLPFCRIALEHNNEILGWSALTKVSNRQVYAGVAEVSIYIHPKYWNKKVGTKLLLELIERSEQNGIWTLQCGIMSDNLASIKLHEKCGFRIIGYREKIGCLNGIWKDNVLMERRSKRIGV
ncbi:MAG: N-acetyltransferase [Winogradskyella sp.]|uniref:GNAT family N-acetyltransferase n=1 Tax=Winogradskyella sp. TaxID=1883156 RepID=UPI000F3C6596|nr:GNAT family N-acetyltransferase [Winogradskyella sp.]RNC86475.1 MAG: N-acetyltransferase [Winogradskyella sp.]